MQHDTAYSQSKNLKDRHITDYELQEDAWKRVIDPDTSFGEEAAVWLTTNTMKVKRAVGAGVYVNHPINLDETSKAFVLSAVQSKHPVEISVNSFRTKESIMNETSLPLTRYQIKKIKKQNT